MEKIMLIICCVGLLLSFVSGCDTNVEQFQRRNIYEDINNDSKLEVIYLQPNRKQKRKDGLYVHPTYDLIVANGKGDGTFESPRKVLHFSDNVEDLQIKDINGDGNLDVLVLLPNRKQTRKDGLYVHPTYDLMVAIGDGEGNFKEPKLVIHYDEKPGITK